MRFKVRKHLMYKNYDDCMIVCAQKKNLSQFHEKYGNIPARRMPGSTGSAAANSLGLQVTTYFYVNNYLMHN